MGMKRIEVDEAAYEAFMDLQGDDPSRKLKNLVKLGWEKQDEVALVVLEDQLVDLDFHRGQPSVAPFFEGLTRFFRGVRVYRLNFYDAASFTQAIEKAMAVTEERVILYVGAHGTKGRIASANARTIASRIADQGKDKLEGIILSSCEAGAGADTLEKMLEGRANWVFGYTNGVNILSSMLLETAILRQVLDAERDYVGKQETIVDIFVEGLRCFSADWHFGDASIQSSVRLLVRPKYKHKPIDVTADLVRQAWA